MDHAQRRLRLYLGGATIAAASYLVLLAAEYVGRPVGSFDEPLLYVGAREVLSGGFPNLDFASVYPPLNYLPTAVGFALFGETALAARLVQIATYGGLLGALVWLFWKRGIRRVSLVGVSIGALALTASLPTQLAVFGLSGSLLALIAYLRAARMSDSWQRWALLAAAGLLAGLSLLTRVNFGLYALATIAADQVIVPFRESRSDNGMRRWLGQDLAPLSLGVLVVLFGLALVYGGHIRDIWAQAVTTLSRAVDVYAFVAPPITASLRGVVRLLTRGYWLPLLPFAWLAHDAPSSRARRTIWGVALGLLLLQITLGYVHPTALPLLVVPAVIAVVLGQLQLRPLPREEHLGLLAVAIYSHYYLSRPDLSHQLVSTAPVVLLLPGLRSALARVEGDDRYSLAAIGAMLCALVWPSLWSTKPTFEHLGTSLALAGDEHRFVSDAERVAGANPPLAPAMAALYPDLLENEAARFVFGRTRADEPVFSGVADHESALISDIRLTWLLGRPLGARHYMLMGEISNTEAAQTSIVSDLETRHVEWAVLWHAPDPGGDTLETPLPRHARIVDDFIRDQYRPLATIGAFDVLGREVVRPAPKAAPSRGLWARAMARKPVPPRPVLSAPVALAPLLADAKPREHALADAGAPPAGAPAAAAPAPTTVPNPSPTDPAPTPTPDTPDGATPAAAPASATSPATAASKRKAHGRKPRKRIQHAHKKPKASP